MARIVVLAALLNVILLASAAAGAGGPVFQGDPKAIAEVQAAFQKFSTAHTWRARITSPGGGTQTMDHVAPDRFHMSFSKGGRTSDMFMIGREAWIQSGGTCQKLPAPLPMINPRQALEQQSDAKITVSRGGPETVDGSPTQTYMLTVDAQSRQVREKLYVANGSGVPRRVEMPSERGTIVIDYLDYNAPITINNPPC